MSQKVFLFVGIQGSGKGTQAKLVSEEKGFCHISTGDLFRSLSGKLKEKVDSYINQGNLVPDDLVLEMVKERISKPDCQKGIILDGFPRNIYQSSELDKILKVTKVIEIKISDEEALKRLSGRRVCSVCKGGYNIYTAPKPKKENICDKCGGKLIQREDDNIEAIKKRIVTYHKDTKPILDYYKDKLVSINGERDIDVIEKELIKILN
jgi:adenylate kinase